MKKPTKQQIYFRRRLLLCAAFLILLLIIFLITKLISGGKEESGQDAKTTLSFQTQKIELAPGQSYVLIPKLSSSVQEIPPLTYTSADVGVAAVDIHGSVTAIGEGVTNIIAVSADKSLQCSVAVTVSETANTGALPQTTPSPSAETTLPEDPSMVAAIELSTYAVKIPVGSKQMPMVTMKPETAKDKSEIWSSSDTAVATVDKYGNITGVKAGLCTVTVKSAANPAVSAEISVTVTETSEANGLTYIDGILIVNKTYSLPSSYNPGKISGEVQKAFDEMKTAALNDGIKLWIQSGFRSYSYQQSIYNNNVSKYGAERTDTFSARPGHSEHQTGLAFDINVVNDSFAGTPEAIWVAENAHKYGFIVRYPESKQSITGYKYEPWHLRYLGKQTAEAVFDSGLCLEEYLGITSVYSD